MGKKERNIGVRFERECARLLGIRRNLRADWSESAPDLETDRLVIECKKYEKIRVCRWLEQAEGYAKGTGKVPVVFARERNSSRPIAVLGLEDFLEILGESE